MAEPRGEDGLEQVGSPDPKTAGGPRRWVRPALAWGLGLGLAAVHQGTFLRALTDPGARGLTAVAEVRDLILEQWVETPDPKALDDGAVRGLVSTISPVDPFSAWISPDELEGFEEETSGQFGGLGILVEVEQGLVRVIAPIEDTPAWTAGILPGDVILRIDGKEYSFATSADAIATLKGAPGTKIELLVRHAEGSAPPRTVTLERAIIQVRSVKGTRLVDPAERLGYLRVTAFNAGTVDELDVALDDLVKQGLKGLVLDLRGNPGGYLHSATDAADRFLAEGKTIVETRGRDPQNRQVVESSGARKVDVPVVILLDGGTASASEVLAGALRDHHVATIIGTRSFGKGSVQSLLSVLGGDAQLKLTTQYYFTPSGRRIHRGDRTPQDTSWGLIPDLEIRLDPQARQRLAQAEADADLERLKARARATSTVQAGGPAPPPVVDRLPLDDPQVAAALRHLRDVLAGEAAIGAPAISPVTSGATPSVPGGPPPGGTAAVGTRTTPETRPAQDTEEEEPPPPFGE